MTTPSNSDPRLSRWGHRLVRYGLPVFFPVAVATATAIATASTGSIKSFWAITAITATAGSAIFAVLKQRQARTASRAAAHARAQLAAGLNRAGAPLLTALGNVTAAKTYEEMQAAIDVLTTRVIDIAQSQCGRHRRPGASLRSVYYAYIDDRLERRDWTGRQGNTTPRKIFQAGHSPHDNEVIRFTCSEEVLIVDDLYYRQPPHFSDPAGRSYRSFIAVPVRAGEISFGMLALDSDLAGTLSDADMGHMILLAGVLAAGLAHQASLTHTTTPPSPRTPPDADISTTPRAGA